MRLIRIVGQLLPIFLAASSSTAFGAHPKAPELTRLRALQMSTTQLARLLLPDEPDGKFLAHDFKDPVFEGGPLTAIEFFARPVPEGSDLCRRDVMFVSLEPTDQLNETNSRRDMPVRFERAQRKVQIAAAPQCKAEFGAFMAWVQPARELPRAQQALRRLLSLQEKARRNAASVEITCLTDTSENVCAQPHLALLSDLPTDRIFIIDRYQGGWEFSVMPNGPGPGLFWNVRLPDDREAVELAWRIVPPF